MNIEGNRRIFASVIVVLVLAAAGVYELLTRNYVGAGVSFCLACSSAFNYTYWRDTPAWRRVVQVIFYIGAIIFIVFQAVYHL